MIESDANFQDLTLNHWARLLRD